MLDRSRLVAAYVVAIGIILGLGIVPVLALGQNSAPVRVTNPSNTSTAQVRSAAPSATDPGLVVRSIGTTVVAGIDGGYPVNITGVVTTFAGANTMDVNAANSTTTPLGAGATFTGTAIDLSPYSRISVSSFSDVASAANGLQLQFSTDNVNWADHVHAVAATAGTTALIASGSYARYARVVYVNGVAAQGVFRIQTMLHRNNPGAQITAADDPIVSTDHLQLGKNVITGKTTGGGGSYVDVKVTPSGALTADVTQATTPWNTNVSQWLGSTAPTVGQKTKAASVPVTLASDQSSTTDPIYNVVADGTKTGWFWRGTPIGDFLVQDPIRLIGPAFVGATLDTAFWDTTGTTGTGGAGTTTANSVATIVTGTTANATAVLSSARKARFMFAHPNKFRSAIRTSDSGTADNIRRITVGDGTDAIGFVINGAGAGNFGICYQRAGGAFTDVVAGLNGNAGATYTWDTNVHALEIIYFTMGQWWFIDGVLLHKITPTTQPLVANLTLPIRITNTNSGGSTTNVSMEVWNASVLRLGNERARPQYNHIATNTTTVLKRGAGTLHRLTVNAKGSGGATLTLYDNTAASGTVIAVVDTTTTIGTLEYELDFFNGLTALTASGVAADITAEYD